MHQIQHLCRLRSSGLHRGRPPQQSKLGGADPLLRRSKPLVSRGLLPDSLRRREAKKVCGRARFGGRPRFSQNGSFDRPPRRVAKIAKPTGSKLVKGPAESEKFVRWKAMKNSEENSYPQTKLIDAVQRRRRA